VRDGKTLGLDVGILVGTFEGESVGYNDGKLL
jgi:hypothetical protein